MSSRPQRGFPSQHRKSGKHAGKEHGESVRASDFDGRARARLVSWRTATGLGRSGRSGVDAVAARLAGRGSLRRCCRGIVALGVGRTARVVLEAGGGAHVVVLALGDALAAPFGADVVGQAQAVFGDVGLLVVAAEAAIGERFLVRVSIYRYTGGGSRSEVNSRHTGSQSLTSVVRGSVCWQIRGQVSFSSRHHRSRRNTALAMVVDV